MPDPQWPPRVARRAWEVGLAMVNTHEGRVRSPLRPLFPHSLRPAVVSVAARGLYIAALFSELEGGGLYHAS